MSLESRCLTLDERLSGKYQAVELPPAEIIAQVLERWKNIAGGDRGDIFERRLSLDGFSIGFVAAHFGQMQRCGDEEAPDWLENTEAIIRQLVAGAETATCDEAGQYPFGHLLQPIVQPAIMALAAQKGWATCLSETARKSAARQLWQSLAELFGLPLYECFADWRAQVANPDSRFADFIVFMRAEGFAGLFARYPVLARVAGTVRQNWMFAYATFCQRLEADSVLLAERFGSKGSLEILDLGYGLSDPHGGGETVMELRLEGGSRLFYKPRSLACDGVVAAMICKLNALDPELQLRIAPFIDRGDYGWVMGLAAGDCQDPAGASRYYRRAGAWLACFHILNASDIHMENILACGEHPVPVDLETVMQALSTPPSKPRKGEAALWAASQKLESSVLAVGMLPGYIQADDGRTISVGGLEQSRFEVKRLDWSALNSMEMQVRLKRVSQTIDANLPRFAGEPVPVDAHCEDVLAGMRHVLSLVASAKADFREQFSALRSAALTVRRVIRPTRFYYLLLRRLSDHRAMTDGVSWSMQSELIARLYNWDDMTMQPWKLFRQERADLCRMTIPAFHLDASRTVVNCWEGVVTNLHAKDGISVALERLDGLDDAAIELQVQFAAAALGVPRKPGRKVAAPADLVEGIADHLCDVAIVRDGAAAWLGLEYFDDRLMSQIVPIGHDLYNGNLGIALFFAAAGVTRQRQELIDFAAIATAPILGALASDNSSRLVRRMGVGGFVGVGSLVYGLATLAQLIPGETSYLSGAKQAAELLTVQAAKADGQLDLVGGRAGAILGLLKLHDVSCDDAALQRAEAIADTLMAAASDGFPLASVTFDKQKLTGVSHGASGYLLALSALAKALQTERFDAAICQCLDFERRHFAWDTGNWRDTRPDRMRLNAMSPNQWCYGAAGIGYARLSLLQSPNRDWAERAREEAGKAVHSVMALNTHSNDTLCCGIAGHADFLMQAGELLSLPEAVAEGRRRIAGIGETWRLDGDARWDQGNKGFNLGLMRGVAGIGYVALRAENRALPSVLVLG